MVTARKTADAKAEVNGEMPEFSARLDQLEQIADETWSQRQRLDQFVEETRDIAVRLKTLTQMERPLHLLAQFCDTMQQEAESLGRMSGMLDAVIGLYRRAETANLQARDGGASLATLFQQADILPDSLVPKTSEHIAWDIWQEMIEDLKQLLEESSFKMNARTPDTETLLQILRDVESFPQPATTGIAAGVLERCGWWYGNAGARRMCNTGTVSMLESKIIRQLQN